MAKELNYQQAGRIREQSIGSLFADQLIAGKGYKEGFKNVLSLKSKAVSKGIKEKFDPLNIAKVLTGGSRLGPALVGKMLGRSKKDIEYFAGRAMPIFDKISQISQMQDNGDEESPKGTRGDKGDNIKGIKTVLNKILTFLNKSYDKEVTLQEKENNFKESNKLADDRRHNEMLKVLAGISGGSGEGEKPKKKLDIFKSLRDKIKLAAGKAIAKTGVNAAAIATTRATTTAATETVSVTAAEIAAKEATAVVVAEKVLGNVAKFTATKVIPGVGLAYGMWEAAKSAMDGDLYGAFLHAASAGIGTVPYFTLHPLAVAGGMAASGAIDIYAATREVYKEVWGNYPEKDKGNKDFGSKLKVVTDAVQNIVGPSKKWENGKPPTEEVMPQHIQDRMTTIKSLNDEISQARNKRMSANKYGSDDNIQSLEEKRNAHQIELDKELKKFREENNDTNKTQDVSKQSATPVSNDNNKFPAEWGVPDNYQLPTGWSKKEIQKDIVNKGYVYNKKDNNWIDPKEYEYDRDNPNTWRHAGKWRLNSDGTYTRTYRYQGSKGLNVETLDKDLVVIDAKNFGALDKKSLTSPLNENLEDVQTAMANPNMQPESMDSTNKIYDTLDQKQMANLDFNIDKNIPKTNQNPPQKDNVLMAKNDESVPEKPLSQISSRNLALTKTISNLTVTV